MSRIKFYFTIFLSIVFINSYAQEYTVKSLDHDKLDLTARVSDRLDLNGHKPAAIKVYADDNIALVRGSVIGDIERNGMEKIIYLEDGSKQMELVFDNHLPLLIKFSDYGYPVVSQQMTYKLILQPKGNINNNFNSNDIPSNNTVINEENNTFTELSYEEKIIDKIKKEAKAGNKTQVFELAKKIKPNPEVEIIKGNIYLNDGRDSLAGVCFLKSAEMGNNEGMFLFGWLNAIDSTNYEYIKYFSTKNLSMDLLKEAADSGNIDAMNVCGYIYERGLLNREIDMDSAYYYYQKADAEFLSEMKIKHEILEEKKDNDGYLNVSDFIEEKAQFPGGEVFFKKWLNNNISQNLLSDKGHKVVEVGFKVDKDGSILDAEIKKSDSRARDNEALRLVYSMPRWKPAHNNYFPTRSYFTLPLKF